MPVDYMASVLALLGIGAVVTANMPTSCHGIGWWLLISLIGVPFFLIISPVLVAFVFISGALTK